MISHRIHILGASGSGTTTLGRALAEHLQCPHCDTDDYYWLPTDPPFTEKRDTTLRQQRLMDDLTADDSWVLSGSLCGWGDGAIPLFALVVFLRLPTDIRLERLRYREYERYGERIMPGGDRYEQSQEFLDWAASYDTGDVHMRSRRLHEQLMLNIVTLAYARQPVTVLQTYDSLQERRRHVFEKYVDQMFKRRSAMTCYTAQQTKRWLAWLAKQMVRHSQTVFYIEWIRPDWLPMSTQRRLARLLTASGSGLSVGVGVSLSVGWRDGLSVGIVIGLGVGLVVGLVASIVPGALRPASCPWRGVRGRRAGGWGSAAAARGRKGLLEFLSAVFSHPVFDNLAFFIRNDLRRNPT